jgi:hypothetical protein
MDENDQIRVDCYDGAYGLTIRIDTHTLDQLNRIKQPFLEIANSERETIDFLKYINAYATGLDRFTIRRVEWLEIPSKSLARQMNKVIGARFIWSLSKDGWLRCAGLVDGLIDYARPSHQYLTHGGIDDAIVELAFKEGHSVNRQVK